MNDKNLQTELIQSLELIYLGLDLLLLNSFLRHNLQNLK